MTPAERQRRWRENHREKHLEGTRDRYQRRRRKGICNQCGGASGGKPRCEECVKARRGSDG